MGSFVTNNQISIFTGAYLRHWDSFKKQIVIVKEPVKTETTVNTTTSPVFGYEEESQPSSSFTYTTVTGVYDAQVTLELNQDIAELDEIRNYIGHGQLTIKVKQDARDFIEDGRKTERFDYDGHSYNKFSFDAETNFFGLKFYTYHLERTL